MVNHYGEQTASGHLHVPSESKEPYPAEVLEQLSAEAEQVVARYPQPRSALLPLLPSAEQGVPRAGAAIDTPRAAIRAVPLDEIGVAR